MRLPGLALPLMLAGLCTGHAAPAPSASCDFYCYLGVTSRASLVMLHEAGLIGAPLAGQIARGIEEVMTEADQPDAQRTSNYLDFEARLIAFAGAEASQVHMGRSRQDLHGTIRRMLIRDAFLQTFESLIEARAAVLEVATEYSDAVIPAYTHGVQAQPTTMGHYLLAFSAALARDADRMREAWARLNQCPLGAAALGTSGFPLDRARLAELLGFAAPVENSYDANLVSSGDFKHEIATVLALSAIPIGQLSENIHTQYHNVLPWMVLDPTMTSGSSIMPQKSNPRPLDRLRTRASEILGDAQTLLLLAHNTNTGMNDYRGLERTRDLLEAGQDLYGRYASVLRSLHVDRDRALEELRQGYSTTTELADVLVREAGVPFRSAHHFASELTRYGMARGKRLEALTDDELRTLYQDANGSALPVEISTLRTAMDPTHMVAARRGLGGPQQREVERMLASHQAQNEDDRNWIERARGDLSHHHSRLLELAGELANLR